MKTKPMRNSNIELLRIVAMFSIIAFHGHIHIRADMFNYNVLFNYLVGWGGTFGNEVFILITGYFMINRKVNPSKLILLLTTMLFYTWIIFIMVYIFMPQIYATFTIKENLKVIMPILFAENWFVSCYIMFFCFVPYLNNFLVSLDKKKYLELLLITYLFFILLPAVKISTYFHNAEMVLFALTYAVGGYLRLHFKDKINDDYHKKYRKICITILLLLLTSILLLETLGLVLNKTYFITHSQYFVNVFSLPLAVAMFLSFATMKQFFNKYVNIIASTVLGVYLLHENLFLRKIIWEYIFPSTDYITSNCYVLFYIVQIAVIFIVCSGIDLLRKRYIEPPMARFIDRHFDTASEYMKIKANNFFTLLNK